MYVCMCVCVCMHAMQVHACMLMCVWCTCRCMYVCVYVCMRVSMYVCVCVCMCVYDVSCLAFCSGWCFLFSSVLIVNQRCITLYKPRRWRCLISCRGALLRFVWYTARWNESLRRRLALRLLFVSSESVGEKLLEGSAEITDTFCALFCSVLWPEYPLALADPILLFLMGFSSWCVFFCADCQPSANKSGILDFLLRGDIAILSVFCMLPFIPLK
jgi:hypothetical protein